MSPQKKHPWSGTVAERDALTSAVGLQVGDKFSVNEIGLEADYIWDGTTWVRSGTNAVAGIEGTPQGSLVLTMDAGDRASYPGSGTTATDIINRVNGSMTAVTVTDSHFKFNGTTSNINFGTVANGSTENLFLGGGTVSAWMRAESDGEDNFARIVTTEVTAEGWRLHVLSESGSTIKVRLFRRFSSTNGFWDITTTIGEWHHIVAVYDDSAVANDPVVYVDGVSVAVTESATPVGTAVSDASTGVLRVGNNATGSSTFDGDIDIVQMWTRELTATEVIQLYNVQRDRFHVSPSSSSFGLKRMVALPTTLSLHHFNGTLEDATKTAALTATMKTGSALYATVFGMKGIRSVAGALNSPQVNDAVLAIGAANTDFTIIFFMASNENHTNIVWQAGLSASPGPNIRLDHATNDATQIIEATTVNNVLLNLPFIKSIPTGAQLVFVTADGSAELVELYENEVLMGSGAWITTGSGIGNTDGTITIFGDDGGGNQGEGVCIGFHVLSNHFSQADVLAMCRQTGVVAE